VLLWRSERSLKRNRERMRPNNRSLVLRVQFEALPFTGQSQAAAGRTSRTKVAVRSGIEAMLSSVFEMSNISYSSVALRHDARQHKGQRTLLSDSGGAGGGLRTGCIACGSGRTIDRHDCAQVNLSAKVCSCPNLCHSSASCLAFAGSTRRGRYRTT